MSKIGFKMQNLSPLISMENVHLKYPSGNEILHGVNLEILPQSFQYLIGASGAGKSSLLKLMFLALQPSSGDMHIFGKNVAELAPSETPLLRQKIGVVFQDFRLLDHLTIFENVALTLRVRGAWVPSNASDVKDLLEWVGLGDKMHEFPQLLSGGEQQRVAIARALIAKPAILLADEPTGNVDPAMGRRLLRLFVELHKLGTAVVLATHDSTLLKQYPANSLNLANGVITSATVAA